ncbi:hypothetical protein REMIM1_PF00025 (plasmid) [Rhizobium etli bv. mimosae str. Mim1]|nr:hypothetical protein REMIM1_PF00025 [Rhizobium etli bv. mimosae str. Mim1]
MGVAQPGTPSSLRAKSSGARLDCGPIKPSKARHPPPKADALKDTPRRRSWHSINLGALAALLSNGRYPRHSLAAAATHQSMGEFLVAPHKRDSDCIS